MWSSSLFNGDLSNPEEVMANPNFQELVNLFSLATFVQADTKPSVRADAIYLFGHTEQNAEPIMNAGAALYRAGNASAVYITRQSKAYVPNHSGIDYPFEMWRDRLNELGIHTAAIHSIPTPDKPPAHTGTEAVQIVRTAKNLEWQRLIIVAHPIHMLRAFLDTTTHVIREYPGLQLYCQPGFPAQDYTGEVVLLNQRIEDGTRWEGMKKELFRVAKWHAKGDIVSDEEAISYIHLRDIREMALASATTA